MVLIYRFMITVHIFQRMAAQAVLVVAVLLSLVAEWDLERQESLIFLAVQAALALKSKSARLAIIQIQVVAALLVEQFFWSILTVPSHSQLLLETSLLTGGILPGLIPVKVEMF